MIQVDKECITVDGSVKIGQLGFEKRAFFEGFEASANLSIIVGLFGFHGEFAAREFLFHFLILFVEEVFFGGFFEVLEDINGLEVLFIFLLIFYDLSHMVALIDKRNELFAILFAEFGFVYHFEDHFELKFKV